MDLTSMLIGGDWRPAVGTGLSEDVTSPYDGSVVGTVPIAGREDVEAALTAAEAGAVQWRRTPAHTRMKILLGRRSSRTSGPATLPRSSAPKPAKRSPKPPERRLAPGRSSGWRLSRALSCTATRCRSMPIKEPA